tara:strand:- start:323 stop:1114 length:792 start_codon:yes stop_codon:yes gene_type:complete
MSVVPKKSLGQNFLLNKNIIKDIVDLGKINSESIVIEIGPGTGNLTKEILKRKPKRFFAIEKDRKLYLSLKERFGTQIEFINQDVLTIKWEKFLNQKILIFGNLPYNISAKLLIEWIKLKNLNTIFKKFILMFQKEVADRIVADVHTNKYGRLSILADWKMNVQKIMDINPENFYPKPKVQSSLLYLEPKRKFFTFENYKNLEKVTDIFFQNKRKMIKKPLNILFKDSKKIVEKFNLNENNRPQNLDPYTFYKISKEYENEYL